jgi:phosphate transport system ATP-binding protein
MSGSVELRPAVRTFSRLKAIGVSAFHGSRTIIRNVNVELAERSVTAIIGPSGCGKSTFLRCLNRLHEETPDARVEGVVALDGQNLYDPGVEPLVVRRTIGMLLQHPSPFPTMSIMQNATVGLRYAGSRISRDDVAEIGEYVLRQVGLWDEVKDVLDRPGTALSGGQQQRLCIARLLATRPQILLLDEPCAALDPGAAAVVEDVIRALAKEITTVVVTHNLEQAERISLHTAFFFAEFDGVGRMVEFGPTDSIFNRPREVRTQEYLTGRFG